jgi:hypothetical protein
VAGLTGSFGAEEIGQIYAANWERDFSQGNPEVANMVLSWKEVKLAAASNRDLGAAASRFQADARALISVSKWSGEARAESLGGYRTWEHIDNPGNDEANKRWGEKAAQLPGYILDAKAYLKDEMVAAVNGYRREAKLASAGDFDNWEGHKQPKEYGEHKQVADPLRSRAVIAAETAQMAVVEASRRSESEGPPAADRQRVIDRANPYHASHSDWVMQFNQLTNNACADGASAIDPLSVWRWQKEHGVKADGMVGPITLDAARRDAPKVGTKTGGASAPNGPAAQRDNLPKNRTLNGGAATFAGTADHLGRATHVLEDFFAHSNWLEMAKEINTSGRTEHTLMTGTFEMPDKCHALGHKLLALAVNLKKDFDILLKVFGRKEASTLLDQKEHAKDKKAVLDALNTNSAKPFGEIYDVGTAANDANSVADPKRHIDIADVFTNRDWLEALERKARRMIDHGDEASPETGHGKIAKDQPEAAHGTRPAKDYFGAHALAVAADRIIIAPLAAAMRTADGTQAHQVLMQQLQLLDQIMSPPTAAHPLMKLVKA